MRAHISNAAYGVLDYAAYPIGMVLIAPVLLRHLGTAQYGIWAVTTAAVSTGSIMAAGFGDANIQYVASIRSQGSPEAVQNAVRSMMGINLLLGFALALLAWAFVPRASHHITSFDPRLFAVCQTSLRIACLLMIIRAVESVCISTQRALERYGAAVRISIAVRLFTLVAATAISWYGYGVVAIMIATAILMLLGTLAQLIQLRQDIKVHSLWPSFDRHATAALWTFGAFSWLQAVSVVLFNQTDRLLLGVSLGATAVTAYVLCSQIAQPIYGVASAGLHFLFPHLASRQAHASRSALSGTVAKVFCLNLIVVGLCTSAILLFGDALLRAWIGSEIAQTAATILTPIVWSSALLGLSVTGYYALLALGSIRTVSAINLAGGIFMLSSMVWVLPRTGIHGLAMARISYGAISLFMYLPLLYQLRGDIQTLPKPTDNCAICEDA